MSTLIPRWNLRSSSGYFPDGLPSPTVLSFEVNEQNHSNEDQVHMHIGPRRLKSYEEERAGLVASILRVPAPGGRFDPGLCLLGIGEWIVNSGIIRKRGLRNPLAKHDLGTIRGDIREAGRHEPSPQGPKSIGKVFAARHLSKSGPVSYGFTAFGFEDIMFVDIGVYPHNGERAMNRTLVIKDRDGKWYVHPDPSASPLLSDGLNEEKASVEDLTDVYELEGQEH